MNMRNGLSAVLIVKNEEKVLERCLKSLDLVDEIVVLINGTTDRSEEIAREYTNKVFVAPEPMVMVNGEFHFAQARNLALTYAHNDWALTIDADEICYPDCVKEIRRGIWNHNKASGFDIKFIVSNEGGKDPASIPRMKVFRRGHWTWQHRIHETLKPVKMPVRVVDLPNAVMEHLPQEDKTVRRQQNLDLLKISVQESPEYIRNARQLGMELFSREQYRDALPWFELYLASGTGGVLDRSEVMIHMARCYTGIGVLDDALKHFDLAIAEAPMRREPHYYKALAYLGSPIAHRYIDQTIQVLEQCLAIPEGMKPGFFLDVSNIWDGTYPNEALKFCQDQIKEAKQKLEERKKAF